MSPLSRRGKIRARAATTNAAKDDKPEKNPSKDPKKKEEPVTRKDLLALGDSIKEAMVNLTKAVTEK